MKKINLNLPLNSLSFGFVGYQITNQFIKSGIDFDFKHIGDVIDVSSFNKQESSFEAIVKNKDLNFCKTYSRKNPTLKLWHIRNSESSIGNGNHLFTFHELDSLTDTEVNILNNQEQIFVSSKETVDVFTSYGVKVPVSYIPLGYDTNHFYNTNKKYLKDVTVFGIFGKFEKRKNTAKVIRAWLKKYGNNPKYRLHCHVFNPFFTPDQNREIALKIIEGKEYSNINFFGYTKTLGELNDCFNCCDIAIDMSGGEGFSLGSFHCVGLNKRAIIHNVTAMRDWAKDSPNTVLVNPISKIPAADGIFFAQEGDYNIGNIYQWDEEDFFNSIDLVINKTSENIRDSFVSKYSWENTVKQIINKIY